jgi:hypothetical protein
LRWEARQRREAAIRQLSFILEQEQSRLILLIDLKARGRAHIDQQPSWGSREAIELEGLESLLNDLIKKAQKDIASTKLLRFVIAQFDEEA